VQVLRLFRWTSSIFFLFAVAITGCARIPRQDLASSRVCIAQEPVQTPIALGDKYRVYVEPKTFAASGERYLLAGWPNYIFRQVDTGWAFVARDSVFGIVLDAAGRAEAVASPIAANAVRNPRALGIGKGLWAVIFAEHTPSAIFPDTSSALRYWFGTTDGKTWKDLDTLPRLAGGLDSFKATDLIEFRDELLFAVPRRSAGRTDVAIYSRSHGKWTGTVMPTDGAAYVAFGESAHDGPLVGVVRALSTEPDHNSLFLYHRRDGTWAERERLIRGLGAPVHDPELSRGRSEAVLTWTGTWGKGAWTAIAHKDLIASSTHPLAQSMFQALFVAPASANPTWVVLALERDSANTRGEREAPRRIIRVAEQSADSIRVLTSFPSPFEGPIIALMRDTTVLITGPIYRPISGETLLRSDLIRITLRCSR
jgi:hypothetical protein